MATFPNTIFAGTSRGLWLLGDGPKQSPTQCLDAKGVRELVSIDNVIYAGTNDGLFASEDKGKTWAPRGLTGKQVWQLRDNGAGTLYAGTAPAGLYRSTDMGANWTPVHAFMELASNADWCIPIEPPVPAAARALVVTRVANNGAHVDQLRVGVEVGGIALSDDGGQSWKMILPGDNPDLHMMFTHPNEPNTLFASTGYGRLDGIADMVEGNAGVFRSEDAGKSWHYAWHGIEPRYSRPMCIDPHPPYGLTVAAAPDAFSHYKRGEGAAAMLFRSEDAGRSWQNLGDPRHSPSRANFHGLNSDPRNPGSVFVGTDTGEVWRVGHNKEWQLCAEGLPTVLSVLASPDERTSALTQI